MDVKFKFKINQMVITPFEEPGFVSMAAIQSGNIISYFVKLKEDKGRWWDEDQLHLGE